MRFSKLNDSRGFTLIELVIIIVILGILAAVAIPKYQDMSSEAKEASCRAALGSLRSGITIFYANQAVTTGTANWPTLVELEAVGTVMAQSLPPNPYQTEANSPADIVANTTRGNADSTSGGWAYNEGTGEIWPNTATAGENNW